MYGRFKAGLAFAVVAALVVGGLGYVTAVALQLEQEQRRLLGEAERTGRLRLALWRLDSYVTPTLAREDNRPYHHYSAVFTPSLTLKSDGTPWNTGAVLEPSPLVVETLPDWMLLHFQAVGEANWTSPQVLSQTVAGCLQETKLGDAVDRLAARRNQRETLLRHLSARASASALLDAVARQGTLHDRIDELLLARNNFTEVSAAGGQQVSGLASQQGQSGYEFGKRNAIQTTIAQDRQNNQIILPDDAQIALDHLEGNADSWFDNKIKKILKSGPANVSLSRLTPSWVYSEDELPLLVLARRVVVGDREACQGIVLDWPRLRSVFANEVADLFPETDFEPVEPGSLDLLEERMSALPIRLVAGPVAIEPLGWTPMRIGLALSWAAALVALAAVGLGGWSLIDLSQRRIRFVSAVTHELRTPLTTLRLYLDMLAGGLVRDEERQREYLETLNAETDRLNRLVSNVLDFSRLENQRPRLERSKVAVGELLNRVKETWQGRAESTSKELVIDNQLDDATLTTDVKLIEQILGNLVDNACKYSQGAEDRRIWLRARRCRRSGVVFEVEDRGPGVGTKERQSIFRAFRRGEGADVVAGGVGLGLALARRWAALLGGRLFFRDANPGACFQLELPS